MAFSIKNFESITAQMILFSSESSTTLTDFNQGSVVRTIFEAFATELETYYLEMFRGILEGIDAGVYDSFDFPALGAVSASGNVLISLVNSVNNLPMSPTQNIIIPAGFRFQISSTNNLSALIGSAPAGTVYSVTTATTWTAGTSSVLVPVVCQTTGQAGNTAANSINGFLDSLSPIVGGTFTVTNPLLFNNGAPAETQTQRQTRFAAYLASLARGTVAALEYAAEQTVVLDVNGNIQEKVKIAKVVEPYVVDGDYPVGHANIYIYNGTGNASSQLIQNAQNIINGYYDVNGNLIPGYKSAGIIATVIPVVTQTVNIVVNVVMNQGYQLSPTIIANITNSILQYFDGFQPGTSMIYNTVIELIMSDQSVYNCSIISPTGDVIPSNYTTILILGSVTINQVSAITTTSETSTSLPLTNTIQNLLS